MSALKTSGYYLIPNWSDYRCIYQLSCFGAQSFWFLNGWIISTVQKSSNHKEKHVGKVFLVEFLRKKIYGYVHDMKWSKEIAPTSSENTSYKKLRWDYIKIWKLGKQNRRQLRQCFLSWDFFSFWKNRENFIIWALSQGPNRKRTYTTRKSKSHCSWWRWGQKQCEK